MSDRNFIEQAMLSRVKARMNEIVDEEVAEASERVRKRVAGELDKLALSIAQTYDVSMDTHSIYIRMDRKELGA